MAFFVISFKNTFSYRAQVVFGIMSSFFIVWTTIALWNYVYIDDAEMKEIMVIYTILANLISLFYSSIIADQIATKVYNGSFAIDLLRPVSFVKINFLQALGRTMANAVIKGVPLMILLFVIYRNYLPMIQIQYLGISLIAILGAIVLYLEIYSVIGFLAFRFYEIWPFRRLMDDTIRLISGSFIPLNLFPNVLIQVSMYLPFRFLYSFPIELLLYGNVNDDIIQNLILLIIWITISGLILFGVYRSAIKKCVVQGG